MKLKTIFLIPLISMILMGCNQNTNSNNSGDPSSDPINDPSGDTPVVGEKGTLANPYTVAEAIAIIGTNTALSTNEIFVKGIVNANPSYNSNYKSYSAYLVDTFGDSKNIQVYSANIDSKAGYTDLQKGDVIVAGGHYMYYSQKSQPELAGSSDYGYPVIYSIDRKGDPTPYESEEDNGKATETITFDFTSEDNKNYQESWDNDDYVMTLGNVKVINDPGSQYSFSPTGNFPYRFYVGTYFHISVSSGKLKYITFETNENYPFYKEIPVTNAKMVIESNTKTKIFSQVDYSKIKIHNSNNGQTSNVYVKQVRIYKMTVVYYK